MRARRERCAMLRDERNTRGEISRNTREKRSVRASATELARAIASDGSRRVLFAWAGVIIILGSSIAAKLFTSYSHPLSSLSASGLRLEMAKTTDKKISEVYFCARSKKFLTQNLNRQVGRTSNVSARARG